MSDPRLTPDPSLAREPHHHQVSIPLVDLKRTPEGPRDRQLLFGDDVQVYHRQDGWAYLQSDKDGYCGYVDGKALETSLENTHWVCAPATHVYSDPDFKSAERVSLSFASRVAVTGESGKFAKCTAGYIPKVHLESVGSTLSDPVAVAERLLGTPYLWGGNSRWGIDCSGLVQAALLACGIPCPGDSDLQITVGSEASAPYRRNDLLFWKGHVALVSDPETLLHANAHAMAVTFEPIKTAIARIKAGGDGPVIAHRRLSFGS